MCEDLLVILDQTSQSDGVVYKHACMHACACVSVWGNVQDKKKSKEGDAWPRREGDAWPRREGDAWPRKEGDAWPRKEGDAWPRREGDAWPRREGDAWPRRQLLTAKHVAQVHFVGICVLRHESKVLRQQADDLGERRRNGASVRGGFGSEGE